MVIPHQGRNETSGNLPIPKPLYNSDETEKRQIAIAQRYALDLFGPNFPTDGTSDEIIRRTKKAWELITSYKRIVASYGESNDWIWERGISIEDSYRRTQISIAAATEAISQTKKNPCTSWNLIPSALAAGPDGITNPCPIFSRVWLAHNIDKAKEAFGGGKKELEKLWFILMGLFNLATGIPTCDGQTYTVWPGDNLTKIARRCNMSLEDLIKLNNLSDPNNIQIGSTLIVSPGYIPPAETSVTQQNNLREENQALIKEVADKYHVPWQYLDAIWGVEHDWKVPDYNYCQQQCATNQSCGPMQITPSTHSFVDPEHTQDICTLSGAMEIAARILLSKKYCLVNEIAKTGCEKINSGDFSNMSLEIGRNINIYNPTGRPISTLIAVGRYNGNDCYPFSSTIYRWGIKPNGQGYTYCDAVQHIISGDSLIENIGPQRAKYDLVVKCINSMYAVKDLQARKNVDCGYLDGFENRPNGWWTHLTDSSISPADTANLLLPEFWNPN